MSHKQQKTYFLLFLLPFLLPGLLVAAWRCLFRSIAEQKNVYVETVIDFEEMRQLAREEGWALKDLFAAMKKNGASSVAISEDTLSSLQSEGRITVLSADEIRKLSLEDGLKQDVPGAVAGALWVHSEEDALLDRIEQYLTWKLPAHKLNRLHRNFLLINKSNLGFMERVGLGFSPAYFSMAEDAGLGMVLRVFNYPGLTASSAARIINSIPSPASASALLFAEEEVLGNRGDLPGVIDLFQNRSYRIGWIEFNIQEGIGAYLRRLSDSRPFVRVHSISRKEIDQVYNVPRAVARWVTAVKDRSIKMLYIRCFFQDDKKYIADLAAYNLDYLKQIAHSLRAEGFVIAADYEQRLYEPRHMMGILSGPERVAIALSLLLGFFLLIKVSFMPNFQAKYFFFAPVIAIICHFLFSVKVFNAVFGLAGALGYSSLGIILAFNWLKSKERSFLNSLLFFIIMVIPSLLGGLLIAGLHSEVEYLLKFSQFRGIKLAFILPIVWITLWSLKEFGTGLLQLINRPITPVGLLLAGTLGIGITAYLLRSGNLAILKPSAFEDAIRTFLENTLIARPRNKEFLIGYPAAALFVFFYFRNKIALLPVFAVFMQMGQVSVLNTLCHFHSPLSLSLLRIFNGFWAGLLVAALAVALAALLLVVSACGRKKESSVLLAGYLGFGNFGDELLWQTCCKKLLQADNKISISVLLKEGARVPDYLLEKITIVSRKDKLEVLESLFQTKALIFPGGGVLQASTSFASLVYYFSLIILAKCAGAKVLLPAQGIGPWGGYEHRYPRFFRWFAKTLHSLDYLSVRDSHSQELVKEMTGESVLVQADMAFLETSFSCGKVEVPQDILRVAVILRSSETETRRLVAIFTELSREVENLHLIPVALQPEDEKVWHESGWENGVRVYDAGAPDKIFANIDLVVSMRLHGCVVATAKAIPWLGIAYDPKVSSFADALHWKFCYQPDKIDRRLIEEKLNVFAVKKIEYSQKLARKANDMARKASADFNQMLDVLL